MGHSFLYHIWGCPGKSSPEKKEQYLRKRTDQTGAGRNERRFTRWQGLLEEKKQDDIANEMLEIMETGLKMGKIKIKAREELHER